MSWTTIGRILLFVNLGLSLLFAFWGFGIYSQQINWTDKKLGEREGEYAKRAQEIERYKGEKGARALAESRWDAASKALREEETKRPIYDNWYAEQLERLRIGEKDKRPASVSALVFAGGELQLDANGLPRLGPVIDAAKKPIAGLQDIQHLNQVNAKAQEDIKNVTDEINALVKQEQDLTARLGDGKEKGLRFQLAEELQAGDNSQAEQKYIKTPLYNALVEAQSLADRRKVLEARLKELKGAKVARQP
jgi:hypothetical protein